MEKGAVLAIAVAIALFGGVWYAAGRMGPEPAPSADLYGTGQAAPVHQGQEAAAAAAASQGPATSTSVNKKAMQAILHTSKGDITIEFSSATPNTVANFTKLAGEGFYNGTKFHRVIAGFMIQGGDPLTKDDSMQARWGTGGPGYQFADEIAAGNRNAPGTISMANAGPNTNGSQFFINVADNAFLDAKHTVFGKVIAGMDVVSAIERTPTGQNDRPVEPMVITSVELK
jgi:peptidylprolyl isomerase